MSDLIEREAAINAICTEGCGMCAEVLKELPGVGRRGHWIPTKTKISPYQCSECKQYSDYHYDFCPRCLADMRASVTAIMEDEHG